MRIRPNRIFLQSAAKDFKRTGAVAPSSAALGYTITGELSRRADKPIRVLEVGGGTGSITRAIARAIQQTDRLDVYEINPIFSAVINRRLQEDHAFRGARSNIAVYNEAIENIDRSLRYDFIISCLPFTNFEPAKVREIFEIYRVLLNPGGVCSFFEYVLIRNARRFISGNALERRRVAEVTQTVGEYLQLYSYKRDIVLLNLPPAVVHHICFSRVNSSGKTPRRERAAR